MEAVGQLAGGIAHDFNNLLTVIAGYGELARARVGAGRVRRSWREIERAAERADGLTRQLLAFSRRQMLDPVVLDLGEVARGLAPMLRAADRRGHRGRCCARTTALPGCWPTAGRSSRW